jgi:hypothetical protein
MTQQFSGQEVEQQRREEEQEPIIVADRKGIVVVWPDRHTQRFSWSVLRQVSVMGMLPAVAGGSLNGQ